MGAITLPALGLFVATLGVAILSPGPAIIAASRSAAARGRQASRQPDVRPWQRWEPPQARVREPGGP